MSGSVAQPADRRHRALPDFGPSCDDQDIRKPDTWKTEVAKAVERVKALSGLNLDQFADAVDRDPRQVSRWMRGEERPHWDAVLANEKLRQPTVQAFAEIAGHGVVIETVVRLKRDL